MSKKALETLTESMFYVLMAFSRGEKCGTDVVEYIRHVTGDRIRMGPGTLYAILGKFEDVEYIQETEVSGRRRTYSLTARGAAAYENELARLRMCVEDARRSERDEI